MKPLTTTELAAMKERLEKASPGPWLYSHKRQCVDLGQLGYGDEVYDGQSVGAVEDDGDGRLTATALRAEDAQFIAHSRTDMERLIAEVERLQAPLTVEASRMAPEDRFKGTPRRVGTVRLTPVDGEDDGYAHTGEFPFTDGSVFSVTLRR